MDDPQLDQSLHDGALRGLRRINAWSRTASYLWRAITHIASTRRLKQVRVVDVACGGGDLAIQLAKRAARSGFDMQVRGCDISETAVRHATVAARQAACDNCDFFVHDVLNNPLPPDFDIVISTLFLHHLEQAEAVRFLATVSSAARHAVLVDDLVRSKTGYWLAQLGCRALSRSPIVHYDGPVSVLGAFTIGEAQSLAIEAGLADARFQKHWPERYLMTWMKAE